MLPLLPTVLTGVKQDDQFGCIVVKRDILRVYNLGPSLFFKFKTCMCEHFHVSRSKNGENVMKKAKIKKLFK